ncbi:hypothetical protein HELRODRAFT_166785 [Helobdella robusta]|uniref:Uncharacterized protein n=1 Tax=Helobdella robusta TaxID=6412 RepID=T1EYJ0_HELRO|nr:hypothetical protein HELRODRAFT_166785 [Helobdella robusta]ESO11757.1 hypothetical protein HELRODRAFT_166785 [Helobdella robusta]
MLADCKTVLKCLNNNDLLEKGPVFVSRNLNKIPRLENIIRVNFSSLRNEVRETAQVQHELVANKLEACSKLMLTCLEKIDNLASNSKDEKVNKLPQVKNAIKSGTSILHNSNWADSPNTPVNNSNPFILVEAKKKRALPDTPPLTKQATKNLLSTI